ncbi:MAG: autotransporter domain-containing protein [Planctomycetaceae bacterium]|nr:autotransporter domain-containing protein [Planctomycetaceae bacterium]
MGAEFQFNNDTTLQNTYQNPSNWQGTMIVGDGTDGAILTVKSHGGLGDPDEAKVTLNTDSTLVIDTYRPGDRYSYPEQIGQLNVDGDSTVEVKGGNNFITKELTGTAPDTVTKKGVGLWTMLGPSPSFDGTVELAEGGIYLSGTPGSYDSNWGVGTLNVTGDSSLYVDTNSNGRLVAGEIDIDADKVLTIGLVQKDTTYGEVTMTNMTGPGGVNYAGNGTLVYGSGGTIDYTGDTNIFGGTLRVETNTATNYFVKNGGTLQGVGSVTTSGTLTFESGSKLIADYTTGTDPVFAASQVTIHDGAVAHVIATPGSLWDESSAKTLVSGSRTSNDMFWFINNIQGKRTVGEWDGSDNLKIWFIDFDYEDNINTTNANNMVPYLYAIVDNTTPAATTRGGSIPINTLTSDLLKALENTNPSQYNDALLEIGGQINASMVTAQVQTTTGIFQSVTKQLYPAGVYAAQCFNPAAYDDEEGYAVSGGTIYRGQSMRSRWTGWSSGLGGFGNTKDQAGRGTFGYDYNSYGMSFGIEPTTATSANRIGLFYAYTYTEIDTNKTIGSGRINDHFVGGYGRFVDGLGYTSFVAGFGFDKYKTSRSVTMPFGTGGQSRSEFDGWQGGLYVERGLGNVTGFGLQPYAGLQYLYAETDAFAETGTNPYKLETGATSVNSLRSNLGVRIARQICRVQRGNMYVSGSVSWMHEFLDADCVMASKWGVSNNPSTFGVRGNSLGRDWAVIGAGMEWQLRERLSIFGSYDLQINSYQALNIGNIGARIQW